MLIIMGGTTKDRKVARRGGALGGGVLGLLILLINLALFAKINVVAGVDMPTLELAKQIHPVVGTIMSIVLLAMIYSTAVGTLYILAVRIVKKENIMMKIIVILLSLVGYAASLIGFTTLVGKLYAIMGYLGMVLIVAIVLGQVRIKKRKI